MKIQKHSPYWLYGIHACHFAAQNPERDIVQICVNSPQVLGKIGLTEKTAPVKVQVVEKRWFEQAFSPDAVHQGLAMQVKPLPESHLEDLDAVDSKNQIVIVLDQVSDPHNVGAILRSAAVFGATALIMTDRNAPAESAVLAKSACGALELVPIIRTSNLSQAMTHLKKIGFWCYGFAESGDQTIHQVDFSGKIALVMGAEGDGMRRLTKEHCDFTIRFETSAAFSTLNVSNAAAIALHQAFVSQQANLSGIS